MSQDNIVRLVFQTVAAGSGLSKTTAETAELQKKLSKLAQGAGVVGNAFGGMGSKIGGAVSMFLQGGIWGAAAGAASVIIGSVVDKFKAWNKLAEDARLAAQGLSREYMTLEALTAGYHKRVSAWQKAHQKAIEDEKNASASRKKAIEEYLAAQKKADEFKNAVASIDDKIAQEQMKRAGIGKDELGALREKVRLMLEVEKANVRQAESKAYSLLKNGGGDEWRIAEKELALAVEHQKTVVAEAKEMVRQYQKAKAQKELEAHNAEVDAQLKAEQETRIAEKRERAEKKIGELRKRYESEIKRTEDQIEAKKKEAARLEENAARARGKSAGAWMRGERDLARDERSESRKQSNRVNAAKRELSRLEGMNPKAMSAWQKDRMRRLREYIADQDPANNPASREAAALESRRDALVAEQTKKLDEIKTLLEAVTKL